MAELPGRELRYLADQAWAPYGERSLAEVRERSEAVAGYLISDGASAVVVACNSASAAALHDLRARFPETPFIGMEPAVKPAASTSQRRVIGVLATEATFQGELFASVVDRHARDVGVIARACPGLAAAIEDRPLDDPFVVELVHRYTEPMAARGADVIVLGCTHYAFVAGAVAVAAGPGVRVIDPAPAVARRVSEVVGETDPSEPGPVTFTTTGEARRFATQVERLLGIRTHVTALSL